MPNRSTSYVRSHLRALGNDPSLPTHLGHHRLRHAFTAVVRVVDGSRVVAFVRRVKPPRCTSFILRLARLLLSWPCCLFGSGRRDWAINYGNNLTRVAVEVRHGDGAWPRPACSAEATCFAHHAHRGPTPITAFLPNPAIPSAHSRPVLTGSPAASQPSLGLQGDVALASSLAMSLGGLHGLVACPPTLIVRLVVCSSQRLIPLGKG